MHEKGRGIVIYQIFATYGIGLIGALLFLVLNFPIPWILGPITAIVLSKYLPFYQAATLPGARDIAFTILGVQIGLTFTTNTFSSIIPYLFPYTFLSSLMIGISLLIGLYISKITSIDKITALVGSSPGGLSAMIAVSESLKGNSALVIIFHTLRLISVLFIIPFYVVHGVTPSATEVNTGIASTNQEGEYWTIILYIICFLIGWKTRDRVPASLVILPMLIIGGLQTAGLSMYNLPEIVFVCAQLLIGSYLGQTISVNDLIKAGKTCIYFLTLATFVITLGILFSYILSWWTGMSRVTAILALAPGGLIEMAVTAEQANADPAIVSSLQTIRLLTIVLILPLLFKKIESMRQRATEKN